MTLQYKIPTFNKGRYLRRYVKSNLKSKLCFYFFKAVGADTLVVEINNVVRVAAENAGGLIFFKDYLIIIGEDLDGILDIDIHYLSDLYGKNYSSKLVYFSYDSG